MIRKCNESDLVRLKEFIALDYNRNYFIALSLLDGLRNFKEVYIEEKQQKINAALFIRKSGNLQFCSYNDYDSEAFIAIMRNIDFKYLISPESFCKGFESYLIKEKNGAYISKLLKDNFISAPVSQEVSDLKIVNLREVVELYKSIFSGYPSYDIMNKKMLDKRGRGVFIKKNGKIVSVAQTDFETNETCIIVGVATNTYEQSKGYAKACMLTVIEEILKTKKAIYLQYDNELAGKLYEKLGFENIDRVYYYKKGD